MCIKPTFGIQLVGPQQSSLSHVVGGSLPGSCIGRLRSSTCVGPVSETGGLDRLSKDVEETRSRPSQTPCTAPHGYVSCFGYGESKLIRPLCDDLCAYNPCIAPWASHFQSFDLKVAALANMAKTTEVAEWSCPLSGNQGSRPLQIKLVNILLAYAIHFHQSRHDHWSAACYYCYLLTNPGVEALIGA
jgi:hypothetical protein